MSNRPVPTLVTHAQLKAVFPHINAGLVPLLNEAMSRYSITSKLRIAAFLAQTGHECAHFTRFEENLNYSAKGLNATFKKYFPTVESAQAYHRQPEKIANRVYSNRMGNGDIASGDGWKFRGRGAIQLTGRDNYARFATDLGLTLSDAITLLSTPRGAIMSAGWFWSKGSFNALADVSNMREMTRRINGGFKGLEDRQRLYDAVLNVL
jgi:putative chitinase